MKTKTLVFPEKYYFKNGSFWYFNSKFSLKIFILDYSEKTTNWKSTIINITLFEYKDLTVDFLSSVAKHF